MRIEPGPNQLLITAHPQELHMLARQVQDAAENGSAVAHVVSEDGLVEILVESENAGA